MGKSLKEKVVEPEVVVPADVVEALEKNGFSPLSDKRTVLKSFLNTKLPSMFDRTPEITGNLDALVEDIIAITS